MNHVCSTKAAFLCTAVRLQSCHMLAHWPQHIVPSPVSISIHFRKSSSCCMEFFQKNDPWAAWAGLRLVVNMDVDYCRGDKFTKNKNDQWRSAARVSASRCTNPWYMTHPVLPFTIREPRQVCFNCAGLWLWVVWGFRTVQIPLAGRHWYSRAQHSRINYQNSGQEITSKTNTEPPECHWLPATGFQRVQNPDPNKIHNASRSCSRQTTTSAKSVVSRNLTVRGWERKLTKMNWMDGSMMDEF